VVLAAMMEAERTALCGPKAIAMQRARRTAGGGVARWRSKQNSGRVRCMDAQSVRYRARAGRNRSGARQHLRWWHREN
jgi:hypothetical protein